MSTSRYSVWLTNAAQDADKMEGGCEAHLQLPVMQKVPRGICPDSVVIAGQGVVHSQVCLPPYLPHLCLGRPR